MEDDPIIPSRVSKKSSRRDDIVAKSAPNSMGLLITEYTSKELMTLEGSNDLLEVINGYTH
jgi:hypothetical protein